VLTPDFFGASEFARSHDVHLDERLTMKILIAFLFILVPTLSFGDERPEVAAYHKLGKATVEKKPIATVPDANKLERIDVSERFRSASFGHKTTLLVAPDGKTFYVEYDKSTNAPAKTFGPFDVATK
jgi:hypothetical protein